MRHGDQAQAYREAGYCPKATAKTQTENACRFFARSNVIARLVELRAEQSERNKITLDDINERFIWVADTCKEEKQFAPLNQALAHLARINGVEAPTRIQQTTSMDISIEDDLTPQQRENLKKLL